MKAPELDPPESTLGLHDMAFIFFKHKRLVLWSTLMGLVSALAVYLFWPIPFESQSKLLVRYVLDRSMVDPQESQVKVPDSSSYNDNLIAAEKEILSSWDLAAQVAQSTATEGGLSGSKSEQDEAARKILLGLSVTGSKGSNVLSVSYKDTDPQTAQRTLESLINRYFVKHLEVHRSANAFEYVEKETSQVQSRLKQIDDDLKHAKLAMGIISLKESTQSLDGQIAKSREALNSAEEETVAQRARVRELEKLLGGSGQTYPAGLQANKADLRSYQALSLGVTTLRQKQLDLLSRFTPESKIVRSNQAQIGALENQQKELEKKFPGLIAASPEGNGRMSLFDRNPQMDLITERATLAALEEKSGTLREQFQAMQDRAKHFAEVAPLIGTLERQKELEEANYKYFQESLDKARIDEALDPTKIPNISVVQKPTPAIKAPGSRSKVLLGLIGGGLALGLGVAALFELVFDRTVKRPIEFESLNIPRILSIPYFSNRDHPHTSGPEMRGAPRELASAQFPWAEQIRPYGEALRDRLALYFQLKSMNRRPKLIALTGCSQGAGTSTLAGALAAALAKTGKVLFVNMNNNRQEAHPLFEGLAFCSLAEALEPGKHAAMNGHDLCLASANSLEPGSARIVPKKFYELIPNLRESDFEYIIFDMPPLGPTSSTLAMAAFMDKVLLVVEAEVTSKECVKRVYADLVSARADVSALFNKNRTYGPKSLQADA